MPMSLVAVFGASGRQGLAQVRQLSRAGHHVRALSRSADPFYGERFDNTHILPADIMDEPSLQRAFDGVDAVFYTHPLRGPTRVTGLIASVRLIAWVAWPRRLA
jgi:uncharacterized protein YbjT (DUF2867 family)